MPDRRLLLLVLVFAAFLSGPTHARSAEEWKAATVIYSHHEFRKDENVVANSGMIQTAHEQFDVDAGSVTYTVEHWVVPRQMLRLAAGSPVQIAVIGKTLMLKIPGGKTRKLKVTATYPKERRP